MPMQLDEYVGAPTPTIGESLPKDPKKKKKKKGDKQNNDIATDGKQDSDRS